MTESSLDDQRRCGRAVGGVGALAVLLLALGTAAPLQAGIASLETRTDTERNALELQKQIDALRDAVSARSLVLARGDVLFATGTAELDAVGRTELAELAAFLIRYTSHTVAIEGHTDSIGEDGYNQDLSRRRATAVKSYLVRRGVDPTRLVTAAKGEGWPVAENISYQGRQQNRRVEVIIENNYYLSRDQRE